MGDAHARRRLDRRDHGRAPALDRRGGGGRRATDKDAWDELVLVAIQDPTGYVDQQAVEVARLSPEALLARWGKAREALPAALRAVPHGQKMPWFGPPMSPTSMATARFMETWAHALDVYDALGIEPERSDRVRHVAHLGVRTRDFAFSVHELPAPTEEFRVDLISPSGDQWSWGPEDAAQTVTGIGLGLLPAGHPAGAPRRHRPGRVGGGGRAVADDRPGLRRPRG